MKPEENFQTRRSHTRPLLEYEQVMARLANDNDLFKEFVGIFREDIPKLSSKMQEAIERSNPDDLRAAAHAVRGLISNFGAIDAISVARELESIKFDCPQREAREKMRKLSGLIEQLDQELDAHCPR